MKIKIPLRLREMINLRDEREEVSMKIEMERCGVLIGEKRGEEVVVREIVEFENEAESPFFFEIKPETLYDAWLRAKRSGMEVVAIFHTHPTGIGKISSRDVESLKNSGIPWVIVGMDGIKAYLYDQGVKEIDVEFFE